MALAIDFEQSNNSLGAPEGLEHQVNSLRTMLGIDVDTNKVVNTSKWEFEPYEIEALLEEYNLTGKMTTHLTLWGVSHSPLFISKELPEQVIPKTLDEIVTLHKEGLVS